MKTITCDICGEEITEKADNNKILADFGFGKNDWYKVTIKNVTKNKTIKSKDLCDECRYVLHTFIDALEAAKGFRVLAARTALKIFKKHAPPR